VSKPILFSKEQADAICGGRSGYVLAFDYDGMLLVPSNDDQPFLVRLEMGHGTAMVIELGQEQLEQAVKFAAGERRERKRLERERKRERAVVVQPLPPLTKGRPEDVS